MAQRPKRFKRVSVSFPIDLYAKVDAAYRAAPPHSINSWVVQACKAALPSIEPEVIERREPSPLLAVYATPEFKADWTRENLQAPQAASVIDIPYDPESLGMELAIREFGLKTLAVAARTIGSWNKWDWKQRLEHLRELKAAAVSG